MRELALAFVLLALGCKTKGEAATNDASAIVAVDAAVDAGKNTDVILTWRVGPADPNVKHAIELTLRYPDGQLRRFDVGPVQGVLIADYLTACGAKPKTPAQRRDEVARLTFSINGFNAISARRTRPDMLQLDLVKMPASCDTDACESHSVIATFPIPADARIVEKLIETASAGMPVADAGKDTPFDCKAPVKLK